MMHEVNKFPDQNIELQLEALKKAREFLDGFRYNYQTYDLSKLANINVTDVMGVVTNIIDMIDTTVIQVGDLTKYVRDLDKALHEMDPTKEPPENFNISQK